VEHSLYILLSFNTSINLGHKINPVNNMLVDLEALINFILKTLYDWIEASNRKYKISNKGWMRVAVVGLESGREKSW
jgi:hypothetical protein